MFLSVFQDNIGAPAGVTIRVQAVSENCKGMDYDYSIHISQRNYLQENSNKTSPDHGTSRQHHSENFEEPMNETELLSICPKYPAPAKDSYK